MVLMSKEEASNTLHFEGLDYVLLSQDRSRKFDHLSCYLPKGSSVQQVLAERLAYIFCRENECWAYVTDWNASPTSMCYDLFYGYRLGRGDRRPLAEASVYNFLPEDAQSFMSVIGMILYFSWDAWIFDARLTYLVNISNDGIIECSVDSHELKNQLAAEFSRLNMPCS
jgi:hypothetical protein